MMRFQSTKLKFQSSRSRFHCIQHVMKLEVTHVCTLDTLNGMSILEGTITKDACLEVVCENGVTEVSDKKKVNCKSDGFARYMVHCLNGKAIAK